MRSFSTRVSPRPELWRPALNGLGQPQLESPIPARQRRAGPPCLPRLRASSRCVLVRRSAHVCPSLSRTDRPLRPWAPSNLAGTGGAPTRRATRGAGPAAPASPSRHRRHRRRWRSQGSRRSTQPPTGHCTSPCRSPRRRRAGCGRRHPPQPGWGIGVTILRCVQDGGAVTGDAAGNRRTCSPARECPGQGGGAEPRAGAGLARVAARLGRLPRAQRARGRCPRRHAGGLGAGCRARRTSPSCRGRGDGAGDPRCAGCRDGECARAASYASATRPSRGHHRRRRHFHWRLLCGARAGPQRRRGRRLRPSRGGHLCHAARSRFRLRARWCCSEPSAAAVHRAQAGRLPTRSREQSGARDPAPTRHRPCCRSSSRRRGGSCARASAAPLR